jgi:hypothetical protein
MNLVCHCQANEKKSLILLLDCQGMGQLSEESWEFLWEIHPDSKPVPNSKDIDFSLN